MAEESHQVEQDEIEQLLRQAQEGMAAAGPPPSAAAPSAPAAAPPAAAKPKPAAASADNSISQDDIELLLRKAEMALASVDEPVNTMPAGIQTFKFNEFAGAPPTAEAATLELMRDVQLDLTIELGRTHMHLEEILKLRQGTVVPLDKLAGDPADIYVNGRLIARGEVLVLNDNFCVRVAELIVGESACA
ncbi:flagellar motor switch protein FliN [Lacipirellula parvula]|uniref:Flagellar motor switch protein FliN n=1 Tax=Lacipirellula parvula TaxID=2650471 RepID=A0A5K7XCB2_9BACT|nr:flagellar motor switch protein FliN [Lacipirellula parvula]BBO34005.1 flagellar motor switch protein FliN [Lacipirellula parvula]